MTTPNRTVRRTLALLEAVADRGGASARELAEQLDLPLPTVYRLAADLVEQDYLVHLRAEHRFELGFKPHRLGLALHRQIGLSSQVRAQIVDLHRRTVALGTVQVGEQDLAEGGRVRRLVEAEAHRLPAGRRPGGGRPRPRRCCPGGTPRTPRPRPGGPPGPGARPARPRRGCVAISAQAERFDGPDPGVERTLRSTAGTVAAYFQRGLLTE